MAISLNNLAQLYQAQEQYAQAEPLLKRALEFGKGAGTQSSQVAMSLNNLALLYTAQKQYSEAEPLFKRVFAISKKTFGPNHPTWL